MGLFNGSIDQLSIFTIFLSVIVLIATIIVVYVCIKNRKKNPASFSILFLFVISITLLLVSDIGSWYADNYSKNLSLKYVFSILDYITPLISYNLMVRYVYHCKGINEYNRTITITFDIMCVIWIIMALIFSSNGYYFYYIDGTYLHGKYYVLSTVFPIIATIWSVYIAISSFTLTNRQKNLILIYLVSPAIGFVLKLWFFDTFPIMRLITVISMLVIYINIYLDYDQQIKAREEELDQSRIDIMVSQIQPHFLYNTLNSIAGLCLLDPMKARQVTLDFSKYMRANLNSLNKREPVSFDKELEHLKAYLNIELVRFEDKLKVEYDIKETDFIVPALSIQPIVENAVKHGVCEKAEGGVVSISTTSDEKDYYVIVKDNGVGFDPVSINWNDGTHVGIVNVRDRLKKQCNATIIIDSVKGKGTTVTVCIPKGK